MRVWSANLAQSPVYRRRLAAVIGATLAVSVAAYGSAQLLWRDAVAESSSAASETGHRSKSAAQDSTHEAADVPAAEPTSTETVVNAIGQLDGSAQIATSGFTLDTDTQLQLENELNAFASYGYSVSFVLVDVASGKAISSYANTARYSASAIKGPYVLSIAQTGALDLDAAYLAETDAGGNTQYLIDQAITVSDNTAYKELHDTYGTDGFAQWSSAVGVSADVTQGAYLNMSAADLARMWAAGYGYLFDDDGSSTSAAASSASEGDDAAGAGTGDNTTQSATDVSSAARQWLAGEFSSTLNSTIHMALGEQYSVYTKAGWINGEGGYYALNDAGIVRSSSGDYVLAVMSDACEEYDLLSGLVSMLDTIHSAAMTA